MKYFINSIIFATCKFLSFLPSHLYPWMWTDSCSLSAAFSANKGYKFSVGHTDMTDAHDNYAYDSYDRV